MEEMLSVRQMELSYRRLTFGVYENGEIEQQEQLEGDHLGELADRLMALSGSRLLNDESENPLDAIRQKLGSGTALFVIYEEVHVKFSEARLQVSPDEGDSPIAEDESTFLEKIMALFSQLETDPLSPGEELKKKIEGLVDKAFDDGKGRLEGLGDVDDDVQRLIDRMFREIHRLIERHFSTSPDSTAF